MNDNKRAPSLEELLRLKRAERPAAEFWTEFDRQLRAKQLAALVEKRPWWQNVRLALPSPRRLYFPLGASGLLLMTFMAIRDNSTGPTAIADSQSSAASKSKVAVSPAAGREGAARMVVAPVAVASETPAAVPAVTSPSPVVASLPSATTEHEAAIDEAAPASRLDSFAAVRDVSNDDVTPSARFIAANLAAAQERIGATLLAEAHGFESRGMPTRVAAVEPLQQMTPPGDSRRSSRFLAAMVSNSFSDSSLRTAERVASRISVEELYEQTHRFGTRRGGVNMKF